MSGVPVPSGEATTKRPAFARAEFASGRKSFRMFRVVDLSVEAPVPYGGSVAIASTRVTGMFRASPLISPDGSIWKYLRFVLEPLIIRLRASIPITSQPKRLASRRMPPTPQNGSRNVVPPIARDKLTMIRASLVVIVLGWNTGLFRGLRLATYPAGRRYATRPRGNQGPPSRRWNT